MFTKSPQVHGRGGGHGKPIAYLLALDFLDTYHQEIWLHTNADFVAQLLGKSKSFLPHRWFLKVQC
jgi:hypothetical protein